MCTLAAPWCMGVLSRALNAQLATDITPTSPPAPALQLAAQRSADGLQGFQQGLKQAGPKVQTLQEEVAKALLEEAVQEGPVGARWAGERWCVPALSKVRMSAVLLFQALLTSFSCLL